MDVVLELADAYCLDSLYATVAGKSPLWQRSSMLRQLVSLSAITWLGAIFLYFFFATLSYIFIYDKRQMKDPKFLPNQIQKEIAVTMKSMPLMMVLTVPWFLGEVRGYAPLYRKVDDYGVPYLIFSATAFLFFTDMMVYWVHRWLHHPLLYAKIHKPHHKWIVPTPYASHAFHPIDGYSQSLAYHCFAYLLPVHSWLYMGLYVVVNIWSISIHDGAYLVKHPFINSSAHHTVHHRDFNYNYGQYFTLWDRIGGSYRQPSKAIYDMKLTDGRDISTVCLDRSSDSLKSAAAAEKEE